MKKEILLKVFEGWMAPRLAAYQEPTREGTARGSSVGFSKTKYYAAHLMILHELGKFPLADLAIKADVSHELIRKWRTEKEFKNLAYFTYKEFLKFIEDKALMCFNEWTQECEKYFAILEIRPPSTRFKINLFNNFYEQLINKSPAESVESWLEFFVASKFNLIDPEKDKLSFIDVEITNTFILWLLTFTINSNIAPIQKKLIELLMKQLFPDEYKLASSKGNLT